ncbi:MAG: biotin--[acetyl-CoA-carboxylase] ligase [Ferruginibacter sp.]|nr:biotin--[acetyl-CoA-carboxylase] ligase [Ferruginibacter sp.]
MIHEIDLFTILDVVESTNNYAMGQVHAGLAVHGQAWFARDQWGGRGQRGNKWISRKEENLIMTVVFKPDKLFKSSMFLFNMMLAGICHQFFAKIAGTATTLKWPNDIYYNDRKAGGILIENIIIGNEWTWSVVGIGVNVNQLNFDRVNQNATSLRRICDRIFDPIELAKKLHIELNKNIEAITHVSKEFYFDYYNEHLYKKGKTVKLKKDNIIFSTCIKEVNRKGQLVTFDAIERQFNSGEIKWIL